MKDSSKKENSNKSVAELDNAIDKILVKEPEVIQVAQIIEEKAEPMYSNINKIENELPQGDGVQLTIFDFM